MGEFRFKQFAVSDDHCGMKICTDSVLLGAWARFHDPQNVLDLGAGSGVLALMMAQRYPHAEIAAVEIDSDACSDAESNFLKSPWANRLNIVNENVMRWRPATKFDAIISNPPYFTSELKSPDSQRAAARHADTFGIIGALQFSAENLSDRGELAIVAPALSGINIIWEAEMVGLKLRRRCLVSTSQRKSPTIALWQFSRIDGPVEEGLISIHNGASFSQEYVDLTRDFYLKF